MVRVNDESLIPATQLRLKLVLLQLSVQGADPGPTLKTGWRGKEKADDALESPQIGLFPASNNYLFTLNF